MYLYRAKGVALLVAGAQMVRLTQRELLTEWVPRC